MSQDKKPFNKLLIVPVVAMLAIVSITGINYAFSNQSLQNQTHVAALAAVTSSVNAQVQVLRDQGKTCSVIYGHNEDPVVVVIECDEPGGSATSTTTETFTLTSTNTINSTEIQTSIINSTNTVNSTQTFTAITNSTQIINSTNTINSTQTIPITTTSTHVINSTKTIPVNVTSTILSNETTTQTVNTTITETCSDFGNGTIICG